MKTDPYSEFKQDLNVALAGAVTDPKSLGYVYVIKAIGHPYVKIGCSQVPKIRVSELQTGNFAELALVAVISIHRGNLEGAERAAHKEAIRRGHHYRGEWFECSPNEAIDCALTGLDSRRFKITSVKRAYQEALDSIPIEVAAIEEDRRAKLRVKLGID